MFAILRTKSDLDIVRQVEDGRHWSQLGHVDWQVVVQAGRHSHPASRDTKQQRGSNKSHHYQFVIQREY